MGCGDIAVSSAAQCNSDDAWCWEDDTVHGREELGKLERKSNMNLISTHHCFVCPVLSKVLDSS